MKKILAGLLSITFLTYSSMAFADQIIVSGNGEGSNNNVSVTQTSTTETTQTNTATVDNNVNQTTDTGNNDANHNNGEASITTGDANATTNIANEHINENFVDNSNCCPTGDLKIAITNNGEGSTNGVSYGQNNTSNVNVSNTAGINNNVNGNANTGWNNANHNNGNVTIDTGDIKASVKISNKWINSYAIKAGAGNGQSATIIVDGNAENSTNLVKLAQNNTTNVNVFNSASLNNNVDYDLNTGGNNANHNNGNVTIGTGDIAYDVVIDNGPVNIGYVDVDCCDQGKNPPPDGTTPPPTTNTPGNPGSGGGGGSSSGGGSSNNVATTITNNILPVTGNYFMLFLMIGNVVMFLLGGYLRLHSGRAPNLLFAR